MKQLLLPLIIITLIVTIFVSTKAPNIDQLPLKTTEFDYAFKTVKISLLQNGKEVWTLLADDALIYTKTESFLLNQPKGLYQSSPKKNSNKINFSSPTGFYNYAEGQLKLVETSATLSIDQTMYYLTCDELKIDTSNQWVSSYGNIQINTAKLSLSGAQLTADLNTNQIILSHNINGTIITPTIN